MNKLLLAGLLTSLTTITNLGAHAQDTTNTIGNVSIASPTAASLGKYGDIPVSYNTGIPNISIPIYTVKAGSLSLPISLSYHASGLKVQEQASWVGAGWSLNAGGVITRTVVGAPDDRGVQSSNVTTNGYYSDSGYNSYLFINCPTCSGHAYDGYWADDITFFHGYKDGEPDLFFFNFGGYTGKFYFNDDQTPVFVPDADFRVQVNLNNGVGGLGFQGFIITTPDGVKYYFGMSGNDNDSVPPIETTSPTTIQNNYLAANQAVSSWYLNKVVSADGVDSINLLYQPENYSYYTLSMFPVTNVGTTTGIIDPSSLTGFNLIKNFVQGVRLSKITFPNGSISFTPAATSRVDMTAGYTTNTGIYDANNTGVHPAYALGSISISNTSGFCKKDSFYYAYFYDNNALTLNAATYSSYNLHSDAYRLKLDSVQEFSCDGTVKVQPYAFTYYSELVPRKLSFGIDHWGFSNGVTNNQVLIPTYAYVSTTGSTVQVVPGANRDAAWPAMRGGALQQITYPTGGFTQFTYQPNDTYVNYTKYMPTPRLSMSCGYDGHNGTLGDGGDNPDTATFISAGGTLVFTMSNSSSGGNAQLEIFNSGTNTLAYNVGTATPGQTDTFYFVLSPGTYWAELTKSSASSGHGVTATITENVGVGVSGNDTVGGLRIGTLTSNDGITPNNIATNYTYTTGGTQSSGILYSRPVYVMTVRNDAYGWVYGPNDGSPGGCALSTANYYVSPTSISPMQEIQGNHIGYNQVQVSQPGNGYTIYRYYGSNYWDYKISDVCTRTLNTGPSCTAANYPNFPASPLPFDPMRGELKYMGHFNHAGQVLKDISYTPVYVFDSLVTPALKYMASPYFYVFTSYSLQSARKVQTTTVSSQYDPNSGRAITGTSKVYYNSLFHTQPTRQVATTSTGDSLATNTQYILDFRVASCDAIPDSMSYFYNTAFADSLVFFTDDTIPPAACWLCRSDTLQNLRRHVNLLRQQFVRYRRRSFDGPSSIQGACYVSAEAAADTALKPVLRLQDEFDNVPIETSQWRDNRLVHASFNKYDTSLSPIGVVYPDRTQLINLQTPSTSFTPAAVSGSTISKDSRYLDETVYQFSNGNPQQVTPHSGIAVVYIWDYLHEEPIAKVTNAAVSQVAYTSFEADGNGSWTIPSSTRVDTAITGSVSYNLSNGSITRSGLTSGSTYIVSYWSKTGSSYSVSGTTGTVQGKTISINGGIWTYFEHTVTSTTSLTISGSGDIDELRLYPSNAQMTTYTYTPLLGMTSQCDVDNRVSYYIYDALGRMKYIRDQDGNILKTIDYHYQGQ
jgi:hypothetical protein